MRQILQKISVIALLGFYSATAIASPFDLDSPFSCARYLKNLNPPPKKAPVNSIKLLAGAAVVGALLATTVFHIPHFLPYTHQEKPSLYAERALTSKEAQDDILGFLEKIKMGLSFMSSISISLENQTNAMAIIKKFGGVQGPKTFEPAFGESSISYWLTQNLPFDEIRIVTRIIRKEKMGISFRFLKNGAGISFDYSKTGRFFNLVRYQNNILAPVSYVGGVAVTEALNPWDIVDLEIPDNSFEREFPSVTRNPDVVIGVIDSGIDYNHPKLALKLWRNPFESRDAERFDISHDGRDNDGNGYIDDEVGANFVEENQAPYDYDSKNGSHGYHGTLVSGIAAQGSSKIKIMSLRTAFKEHELLSALRYILDFNFKAIGQKIPPVRIVNLSFGYTKPLGLQAFAKYMHEEKHILFVAAAGNKNEGGSVQFYPAAYPIENLISVAALNKNGTDLTGWSAADSKTVDLAAPGESVDVLIPGGLEAKADGTSLGSPHVSNVAAKIWLINPALSPLEVKNILTSTADQLPRLKKKVRYGKLNAQAAYQAAFMTLKTHKK